MLGGEVAHSFIPRFSFMLDVTLGLTYLAKLMKKRRLFTSVGHVSNDLAGSCKHNVLPGLFVFTKNPQHQGTTLGLPSNATAYLCHYLRFSGSCGGFHLTGL